MLTLKTILPIVEPVQGLVLQCPHKPRRFHFFASFPQSLLKHTTRIVTRYDSEVTSARNTSVTSLTHEQFVARASSRQFVVGIVRVSDEQVRTVDAA